MSDFIFYPGDRVRVVPIVITDTVGLAPPIVSSHAGEMGTVVRDAAGSWIYVYMDGSIRPKPLMIFNRQELQVVVESVIGPFS